MYIEITKMLFGDYVVNVWGENFFSHLDREYFCRGFTSAMLTALEIRTLPGFSKLPIQIREGENLIKTNL